mmetsp:Transcript_8780/g.23603  ORF Transcript_8780/g.23603 Transcript_8780/m.23603 type:complete len:294 (+) Transcript_8780:1366-2247(+)
MTPGLENRLFPGLVTSPFVNTRSSRDPAGGGSLSRASGRAALSPAAPASPLPRNGVSASPPRPPNRSKRRALALSFTLWLLMFVSMPLLRALWLHVSPWSGHAAVFVPLLPMSWLTIPSLPEPVPKANELRVPWVGLLAAQRHVLKSRLLRMLLLLLVLLLAIGLVLLARCLLQVRQLFRHQEGGCLKAVLEEPALVVVVVFKQWAVSRPGTRIIMVLWQRVTLCCGQGRGSLFCLPTLSPPQGLEALLRLAWSSLQFLRPRCTAAEASSLLAASHCPRRPFRGPGCSTSTTV